jgi:cytosine/uracil/thiamine/allantoin permease
MANKVAKFKRGATFNPTLTLPATGTFTNLIGVSISSAVVTVDGKVYNATITIPDPTGRDFIVRIDDTTRWPVGDAIWDVAFYLNGVYAYTETILIHVMKSAAPRPTPPA